MLLSESKILIGDDSILARKQLKDILSDLGATHYIEAANGQEAIDKYNEDPADIVFLDIVMPVKDGVTATRDCSYSPVSSDYYCFFHWHKGAAEKRN